MRISARAFAVTLVTALAFSGAGVYGSPVSAQDDRTLAALQQVVPDIVQEAQTVPPVEIPEGNTQRVFAAATDPGRSLVAVVSDSEIGIGLPEAADAGNQALPGLVTYAAAQPSVSYAHQRTDRIARSLTIIHDASAPTEYRFPISAPPNSELQVEEDDGTVLIYTDDVYLAEIDLPWAKDANGNTVPTSYRVEGMTLVQTVNHAGAAYPVVADPALKLQCEWWKAMCRLIFSRKLTKQIYGVWLVGGVAGAIEALKSVCDKLKGKAKVICKTAYTVAGASAIYKFRDAARQGQCFAVRFQAPGIVWYEVRKKSCMNN
ncbi:hypothetical protein [Nonomuraea soli]|uniref:Uncharacterized protein n=1 Tax=Nonomuraea soli TaxID=1032476 RepID=A0A7W0CS77_9ACTN|nr:hypothetical protein [Nonomuraea soli]MBA2896371.1 hypothetical protein [Nonomuraea soli]